jgi:hypothetical protein
MHIISTAFFEPSHLSSLVVLVLLPGHGRFEAHKSEILEHCTKY